MIIGTVQIYIVDYTLKKFAYVVVASFECVLSAELTRRCNDNFICVLVYANNQDNELCSMKSCRIF